MELRGYSLKEAPEKLVEIVLGELEGIRETIGEAEHARRVHLIRSLRLPTLLSFRPFIIEPDFAHGHILSILKDLLSEMNDVDNPRKLVTRDSIERVAMVHEECVRMRREESFPKRIGLGTDGIHRMLLIAAFLSSNEETMTLTTNMGTAAELISQRPLTYRSFMELIPQLGVTVPLIDGVI